MSLLSLDFKKIPIFGTMLEWLQDHNMDYGIHITIVASLLLFFIHSSSEILLPSAISFFFFLAPLWLPYMALNIFHFRWVDYVTKKFYLKNGRTLYRIKLPQEVTKSPEAMEFVFNQLWTTQNPDNYWQTYIDGKNPLPVSLEMVSVGGDVRLYVNLNSKKTKEGFIPAIYSQYPGIELIEEPVDYAAEIIDNDPEWDIWVTHIGKKEKKWGPIKTYIDFGMDKLPKEEEKIDPMTTMLEHLGSIEPYERLYVQIVMTAFRKPSFLKGQFMKPWGEGPNWTESVKERVDELMQRDAKTKAPKSIEGSDFEGMPRITPGERGDIETIERHITKYAFNVGIRYLYAAKKGHFRSVMLNPLNRLFSQFDKIGRGSLGVRWRTDFDYMWFSDPFGNKLNRLKNIELRLYKLRKFVPHSLKDTTKIMTTEELATLFHIPGKVAITPTLGRIPSTTSQAPSNLPVGEIENNT